MKLTSSEPKAYSAEQVVLAQQGNSQALDWVMEAHQRLIGVLAQRFQCEWADREELVQAGYLGLLMALRCFDSSKGAKLSTYAIPWILGEMRSVLRRVERAQYSLDEPRNEEGRPLVDILAGSDSIHLTGLDLRLALSKLNKEEQILVSLRYFRGRTQKETAVILKKSQAQISKTESRIIGKLREMLS